MHVDKISLGKECLKFQMQMKFSRIFKQHLHDDENRVSHYQMIYKESILTPFLLVLNTCECQLTHFISQNTI